MKRWWYDIDIRPQCVKRCCLKQLVYTSFHAERLLFVDQGTLQQWTNDLSFLRNRSYLWLKVWGQESPLHWERHPPNYKITGHISSQPDSGVFFSCKLIFLFFILIERNPWVVKQLLCPGNAFFLSLSFFFFKYINSSSFFCYCGLCSTVTGLRSVGDGETNGYYSLVIVVIALLEKKKTTKWAWNEMTRQTTDYINWGGSASRTGLISVQGPFKEKKKNMYVFYFSHQNLFTRKS